jgi:branched-subunit amino acid aminotransferase/4-amino-4-deoxychorismate lyase
MIKTAILSADGLRETDYHAESLADAVQYEPAGVYTVTRSYNGHYALLLDDHLARLEESARLEEIPLVLDRAVLRAALRDVLPSDGDSRFRITIPRDNPTQIVFAAEPLPGVPAEILANGARVVTISARRQNPVAKATDWMHQRKAVVETMPPDIYEMLLVDEDEAILEGAGSNFFAIMGGELRTAEDNILKGIARKVLLTSVQSMLPIHLQPVTLTDLPTLAETFLTSSSRGVVPIVEINAISIGDGKPGKQTRVIADMYNTWTQNHLQPI